MVSRLREHFPDMRVLFLTGYDDFSFAYEAFRQLAVQDVYKRQALDGAGRFRQILHVAIPSILPIVLLMTVLSVSYTHLDVYKRQCTDC